MRGFLRSLLVWTPALLAAGAGLLSALALTDLVPGAYFLPVALLLLAGAMFLMLIRQGHLEETVMHRVAEPGRLIAALRRRIAHLEREVEQLLQTSPEVIGDRPPAGPRAHLPTAERSTDTTATSRGSAPKSTPTEAKKDGQVPTAGAASGRSPTPQMPPKTSAAPGGASPATGAATPTGLRLRERGTRLLEGFRLYMEPVIDRHHKRTALYRALPGLPAEDGRVYIGADASIRAARLGITAELDARLLETTRHFAIRLRQRGRPLPVICPLSAEFYLSPGARERLAALRSGDDANLVPEMPQEALATLGINETELLAWLAGRGLKMCLGQADPRRMDAPALAALGFGWVDVALPVLEECLHEGVMLPARPEIIVAGVSGAAAVARLPAMIRLVRGRAFAPPRRVRDEALRPPAGTSSQGIAAA